MPIRQCFHLCCLALLVGCGTYAALSPTAKAIVIAPTAPQGCESVGYVTGTGGGTSMGAFRSNDKLVDYAMNDARNKAADLGATHIQVSPPQFIGKDGTVTSAVVTGTAYRCK